MDERVEIEGCSLSTEDLVDRWAAWARTEPAVVERVRTETGFRVRFRDDAAVREALQTLVDAEADCCGWASWRLVDQDGAPVLEVAGPAGPVGRLAAAFGL